jgi:hypothetical protein
MASAQGRSKFDPNSIWCRANVDPVSTMVRSGANSGSIHGRSVADRSMLGSSTRSWSIVCRFGSKSDAVRRPPPFGPRLGTRYAVGLWFPASHVYNIHSTHRLFCTLNSGGVQKIAEFLIIIFKSRANPAQIPPKSRPPPEIIIPNPVRIPPESRTPADSYNLGV